MEFLVWLALLYLWQCSFSVPEGGVVFTSGSCGTRFRRGSGYVLLHLWPSVPTIVAAPLGFTLENGQVRGRVSVALGDVADAKVAGARVKVGRRTLLRTPSHRAAAQVRDLLASLARTPPNDQERLLGRALRRAFSRQAAASALDAIRRDTLALSLCADLYFVLSFVAAPAWMLMLHAEMALYLLAPAAALVHGACVISLIWALRRQGGVGAGNHLELLVAAALYPPALLRATDELVRGALAEFHPASVAAVLLDGPNRLDYLQCEVACLEARLDACPGALPLRVERECLAALAAECGITENELSAPRESPGDASSFCPVCLSDYRTGFETCVDCRVPTVRYAPE